MDDNIKRTIDPNYDLVLETRPWAAAVDDENCKIIARKTGRQLIEIVYTGDEPAPFICIFKDFEDE